MNTRPLEEYYAQLKGARIVTAELSGDGYDATPVLLVELAGGQRIALEVWQDAEGNGPGFIAGLPAIERSNDTSMLVTGIRARVEHVGQRRPYRVTLVAIDDAHDTPVETVLAVSATHAGVIAKRDGYKVLDVAEVSQ
jgi:hypothetical protein